MTQRDNLYRRPSGTFVLRITVPARHRAHFAQYEFHVSTRTSNRSDAKLHASIILRRWYECIRELEVDRNQLDRTRMALAGKGLISVSELCSVSGLSLELVIRELLNENISYVCLADSWAGFLVSDLHEVDREQDERGLGGYVLNSAFELGVPHTFTSYLRPLRHRSTLRSVQNDGYSVEQVFTVPNRAKVAAFFDLPGIRICPQSLLLWKVQAERFLITPRAGIIAATAPVAPVAPIVSTGVGEKLSAVESECCVATRAGELTSSLLQRFLARKDKAWGLDQKQTVAMHCRTFIDLMGDPTLGRLSRDLMWEYEEKLRTIPANKNRAKLRHGIDDLLILADLARKHGEKLISDSSVERYVESVSSMLAWGVDNMILTRNPARRLIEKAPNMERDQDQRSMFGDSDLQKIFLADWYQNGRGQRTKAGLFHGFSPHYYWLPLIGIYSGARLNEICQLYLSDIVCTDSGVHYFELRLDTQGDEDSNISVSSANDKSLKNRNSKRIIPMHHRLVELGLPEYASALRASKFDRLFPELRYDRLKGYGKAAGLWFNGRYLKDLKIPRDNGLSFHSFRHGFITALSRLETPRSIADRLVGHAHGTSEGEKRYVKDRKAVELVKYIDAVDFNLPNIAPFVVREGIEAVVHALARKARLARERK